MTFFFEAAAALGDGRIKGGLLGLQAGLFLGQVRQGRPDLFEASPELRGLGLDRLQAELDPRQAAGPLALGLREVHQGRLGGLDAAGRSTDLVVDLRELRLDGGDGLFLPAGQVGHLGLCGAAGLNEAFRFAQMGREVGDLAAVAFDDLPEFAGAGPVEPDFVFARGDAGADFGEAGLDFAEAVLDVHPLAFGPGLLLVEAG